ncbi:MAG TPA: phosphotransferase [Armatimonadota bacterium]|jgi:aminoglycoside phosphotransferase (APT) family kinase protein
MTMEARAHHLAALAGLAVQEVCPLSTESRNAIARVRLSDGRSAVLKTYDAQGDPHWANRFRREEKVLALLATAKPAVAPKGIAGYVGETGPAALLMEDVGSNCLADELLRAGSTRLWNEAADYLCSLHEEMRRQRTPLHRTAMAISLDRINGPVSVNRFRIAAKRITGAEPDAALARAFRAAIAPLLTAPKAMIHNSMSPLNVVLGPNGWRAIDWETLTWATPVWDWAELLRSPYNPLPFAAAEAITADAMKDRKAEGLYRLAVLSRHMDSLATVVLRRRRYEAEGRADRAAEYARRAIFYVGDLHDVLARLRLPEQLEDGIAAVAASAL